MTEYAANGNAILTAKADKTLLFSRELAIKINPIRPDITASLILYGLYLWQKKPIPAFKYQPMVNGKRGCYRSLSELQKEYRWLSDEGIRKALNRAEKALKGQFVVVHNHEEADRGKLHFWLSPVLVKKYRFNAEKKMGLLQVQVSDVVEHGLLETILISNLEYVTDEEHNTSPLIDEEGRIYRELSPTKLTEVKADKNGDEKRILPCKRNAVSSALSGLKKKGVFIEHDEKPGFYRLETDSEAARRVASGALKVASAAPKVARRARKVARRKVANDLQASIHVGSKAFVETSYTNTCSNPDTKADSKCLFARTASLRSSVQEDTSEWSSGAKRIIGFIQQALDRQKQAVRCDRVIYDGDEFCEASSLEHPVSDVPINQVYLAEEELHYDHIVKDVDTGKVYTRKAEIDEIMVKVRLFLRIGGKKFKRAEQDQLRKLLDEHDQLHYEHLEELVHATGAEICINGKPIPAPEKGWDDQHWARCSNTPSAFLRYLPRLVKELHSYVDPTWDVSRDQSGKPIIDFSEVPEPYLGMVFKDDTTTPITTTTADPDDWSCSEKRPVYYAEFIGLPTVESAQHECNPVAA